MSIVYTDNQHYSDIADSIRAKLNTQDTYLPEDMADAIDSIPTGQQVTKGLVFSDYDSDGYPTKAEFVGMTVIPDRALYTDSAIYFSMFKNVSHIKVNEGVTEIGARGLSSVYIYEVVLPSTLTTIKAYGLASRNISSLVLPAAYTSIVVDALAVMPNCSSLVFLGDITSIARYAFEDTGNSVQSVTFDFSHCTSVPTLENANAFYANVAKVFKVPQSLLATWQTSGNWANVTNVTWQGV